MKVKRHFQFDHPILYASMMKDEKLLYCLLEGFEKRGQYADAWRVAAELASSEKFPPHHPIHTRLIALEAKLREEQHGLVRPLERKAAQTSAMAAAADPAP